MAQPIRRGPNGLGALAPSARPGSPRAPARPPRSRPARPPRDQPPGRTGAAVAAGYAAQAPSPAAAAGGGAAAAAAPGWSITAKAASVDDPLLMLPGRPQPAARAADLGRGPQGGPAAGPRPPDARIWRSAPPSAPASAPAWCAARWRGSASSRCPASCCWRGAAPAFWSSCCRASGRGWWSRRPAAARSSCRSPSSPSATPATRCSPGPRCASTAAPSRSRPRAAAAGSGARWPRPGRSTPRSCWRRC